MKVKHGHIFETKAELDAWLLSRSVTQLSKSMHVKAHANYKVVVYEVIETMPLAKTERWRINISYITKSNIAKLHSFVNQSK